MKLVLGLIKWRNMWSHGAVAPVILKFGTRRRWVDTKVLLGLIKWLDVPCSGAYLQRLSSSALYWGGWLDSRPDRFSPWSEITATDKRLSELHRRPERRGEEKIQAPSGMNLRFFGYSASGTCNRLIIIYDKFHTEKKSVGGAKVCEKLSKTTNY
jgi:hypothetical protein